MDITDNDISAIHILNENLALYNKLRLHELAKFVCFSDSI